MGTLDSAPQQRGANPFPAEKATEVAFRETTEKRRKATKMSMNWQFKADHPLEQRMAESSKIRSKYPDRIPVIVQKVETSNIERIDKRKYLVPSDITAAQFMWIIRKRINLDAERAIFLFVDKMVPQSRFVQSSVEQCDSDSDSQ